MSDTRITLPTGLSLQDWADQVSFDLDDLTAPQKLLDPEMWQDWAVQFLAYGTIFADTPPNPYMFDDWQDWAQRFCSALQT